MELGSKSKFFIKLCLLAICFLAFATFMLDDPYTHYFVSFMSNSSRSSTMSTEDSVDIDREFPSDYGAEFDDGDGDVVDDTSDEDEYDEDEESGGFEYESLNDGLNDGSKDRPREQGSRREKLNNSNYTRKFPEGILIGVRKGGTGALIRFLALNPKIQTNPGEMKFFNTRDYNKGIEWYRQQMPLTSPDEISFEKSPDYFTDPYAPKRIRMMNSKQKLILVLRDPVNRLVSEHYFHLRRLENGQSMGYLKFYGKEKKSFDDIAITRNGEIRLSYDPLYRSIYVNYLPLWFKHFDRKQILIIDGDRFIIENPAKALQKIEKFLGVPNYIKDDMFYFNETKGFYCPTSTGCVEGKGHTDPPPLNSTVEILRDFYKPHNERLYQLLGYRFSWP